jgi:hypothetical protein
MHARMGSVHRILFASHWTNVIQITVVFILDWSPRDIAPSLTFVKSICAMQVWLIQFEVRPEP